MAGAAVLLATFARSTRSTALDCDNGLVQEVVAEIEMLGRKHIFLVDDNIFVDEPRFEELLEALVPL